MTDAPWQKAENHLADLAASIEGASTMAEAQIRALKTVDDMRQEMRAGFIEPVVVEDRIAEALSHAGFERDDVLKAVSDKLAPPPSDGQSKPAMKPVHNRNAEAKYGTDKPELGNNDQAGEQIAPAVFITPKKWPNEAPPATDWLAVNRFPRGDVSALIGDGGTGKTDGATRLAANVARGAPDWFGCAIVSGPAVPISAEEPEREVRRRFWLHAQRDDGYDLAALDDLHLWFPDEEAPNAIMAVPHNRSGIMQPTPLFGSLLAGIKLIQPVAVIIDNVAATFGGSQNDRVMVRGYVNLWRVVARIKSRPAVILIDHPSLSGLISGSGRSGNMDWWNALRCVNYLYPPDEEADADRGVRILEVKKSNYGPHGKSTQLRLQWGDGRFERELATSSLHRLAKDTECEEIFLRLLDERNAQGRYVSDKGGSNYAPKLFAEMERNGNFTKQAFAKAMNRLFGNDTIKNRKARRDGKLRSVLDRFGVADDE
jgi:RecA-family ATPase